MTRLTARTGRLLGPGDLADRARAAGSTPLRLDRPLVLFPEDGVELTFGRVADHIDDLAARLHAAGVRAGDRVAMCKTSTVDLVLLGAAAGRLGAVPAMVSAAQPEDIVGALLRALERPWLVTDADTLARLRAVLPGAELAGLVRGPVLVTDVEPPAGTASLVALAGADPVTPVTPGPEEPVLITHTSGTTGVPKLTVQSRRSLGGQVPQQKRMFRLFGFRGSMAMCVSLLHARMVSGFAVMAEMRMPTALLVDPALDNVAEVLADFRPGALEAHPNIFIRWEELATHPLRPLASVRLFINGFDAPHPRTIATLLGASKRRFPLYAQGYGQTEIGLITGRLYTKARAGHADSRCVGMSYTGFTAVRVVPANGRKPSATAARLHRGPVPRPRAHVRGAGRAVPRPGARGLVADGRHGLPVPLGLHPPAGPGDRPGHRAGQQPRGRGPADGAAGRAGRGGAGAGRRAAAAGRVHPGRPAAGPGGVDPGHRGPAEDGRARGSAASRICRSPRPGRSAGRS